MQAEKFVLSNNLEVVHLRMPTSQNFRILLNVPVGALHDPADKDGLSHILEHTVFCGCRNTTEKELKAALRSMGGNYSAYTGADKTRYEIYSSAESIENFYAIADILRQFITEPAFDEKRIALEERIIVNELRDSKDNISRNACLELDRLMHRGDTPWPTIIGTEESIVSVTSEDLRNYIKRNYDASQMTLYVAGPLGKEDVRDVLEQTLSAIPNLKNPKTVVYDTTCAPVDVRKTRSDLHQNYTSFMFAVPGTADVRERYIQSAASNHLSSLIPEILRSQYGCFYSPIFGGWTMTPSTALYFFSMSNQHEDSATACRGLVEFYGDIDSILTDRILQGQLNMDLFFLSKEDKIDVGFLDRVQSEYESCGVLFNLKDARKMIESVVPDDIRGMARQILSGLTGMYVDGPEPDVLPPLKFLMAAMRPKQGLEAAPAGHGAGAQPAPIEP